MPVPSAESLQSPQVKQDTSVQPRTISKGYFLLFALVVILVSIGIGIFVYNNNKPQLVSPNTKTGGNLSDIQQLTNQAQQLLDETGGANQSTPQGTTIPGSPLNQASSGQQQWQTYQNEKFSISYPSSLHTRENPAGFGVNAIEFRTPGDPAVPPEYQILIMPKVLGSTIGQNFDTYYAMSDNTATTVNAPDGNSQKITKLQNRTVGGQRAFDFRATSESGSVEVGTYVEMGNSMLIFSTGEKNRGSLDEMLTTFTPR